MTGAMLATVIERAAKLKASRTNEATKGRTTKGTKGRRLARPACPTFSPTCLTRQTCPAGIPVISVDELP